MKYRKYGRENQKSLQASEERDVTSGINRIEVIFSHQIKTNNPVNFFNALYCSFQTLSSKHILGSIRSIVVEKKPCVT